ncbi:hypothetical protein A1356_19240 [Methylomonas koyamae]|uniref:Uncharacterized protein n=1 Tax=Methylomonas koyamae TaxID=702114 RepID=A0AA91D9U7_9GAMM|nr:hypothetical protein A1356_19240 [Methylomonas koyamae]
MALNKLHLSVMLVEVRWSLPVKVEVLLILMKQMLDIHKKIFFSLLVTVQHLLPFLPKITNLLIVYFLKHYTKHLKNLMVTT